MNQNIPIIRMAAITALIGALFTPTAATIAQGSWSVSSLLSETNRARIARGIAPLTQSPELQRAAEAKLRDMQQNHYWGHMAPNGAMAWAFIEQGGYSYGMAGENLARGYSDAQAVTVQWSQSPRHAENLFDNAFQEVGFAEGMIETERGLERVVVQLFATPAQTP